MGTQLPLPAVSLAQTDAPDARVLAELTAMRISAAHALILAQAARRGARFDWFDWTASADMDSVPHWRVTGVPPRYHEALIDSPHARGVMWSGKRAAWDADGYWMVVPHPVLVLRPASYREAIDAGWDAVSDAAAGAHPLRGLIEELTCQGKPSLAWITRWSRQPCRWCRGGAFAPGVPCRACDGEGSVYVEPLHAAWAAETSPSVLCAFARTFGREPWLRALAADKAATNAYVRSGAPLDWPSDALLATVCDAIRAAVPLTETLGESIDRARKAAALDAK